MVDNLVILSAELIDPNLQTYFGELPSCMISFNGRPVIDYIYHENYNHYKKIYLVVCKKAEIVQNYLNQFQLTIELISLEKSNSLLESLQYALKYIDSTTETTVMFGDTYLPYMTFFLKNKNAIFYSISDEFYEWTVANVHNEKIIFHDKKEPDKKESTYNIVIGIFNFLNPQQIVDYIEKVGIDTLSFYDVLKYYFDNNPFQFIETDEWIDYGHLDKYFEHKKNIATRYFNHVEIDLTNMSIRKTSTYKQKLIKEIKWLVNLPEKLKYLVPVISEYSLEEDAPFIQMEYLNYLTILESFVFGNLSFEKWQKILLKIKDSIHDFSQYELQLDEAESIASLQDMYLEKTVSRLEIFRQQELVDFSQPIIVNNTTYPSLEHIIKILPSILDREGILEAKTLKIIHGDLCFSNILYDPNMMALKVIDPRGTFGQIEIYGDPLYDWAKLSHSIDGLYDFIISDKYSLVKNDNTIFYQIYHQKLQTEISNFFYSKIIPAGKAKSIRLIQSLLFFSMLPLHSDYPNRQSVMLSRALELIKPFI